MTKPPITSQIHQPFDIHGDFGPKLSFDFVMTVNHLADPVDVGFCQIISPGIGIHIEGRDDMPGSGFADAVNIGQSDFDPLAFR